MVTGNPLSYRGKTLTWQNGRELATVNGTTTYTYGADGIRTAKTVSGVTTTYALSGSTVLSQTTGSVTLFFYYDANGCLAQIGYKNGAAAEIFFFVTHNPQGDVTAIYNAADSTLVGTYTYDPWGRILAVTPASSASDPNGILTKNPFRYRGYYYDAETGFYYLNSRYYDPETCRFINADMLLDGRTLLGYNLFAYCVNDPVNLADTEGKIAVSISDSGAGNSDVWSSYYDVINGQGRAPYNSIPFGDSTVGNAGCAVIATYNAMHLLGRRISFRSVLSYYEHNMYFTRSLGVWPHELPAFFDSLNIEYGGSFFLALIEQKLQNGGVAIITFLNDRDDINQGAHTVAVTFKDGLYIVYNASNQDKMQRSYSRISDYLKGGAYLYGYYTQG